MGMMAAMIFALQMINFTIPGGTSGHLLGGALVVITLGPYAGVLVLSIVLIVQALVFMDGGVIAIGANVFNMAICGVLSAFLIYILLKRISKSKAMFYVATAVASWFSAVSYTHLRAHETVLDLVF